jgi:hypothetical protein
VEMGARWIAVRDPRDCSRGSPQGSRPPRSASRSKTEAGSSDGDPSR